MLDNEKKSDFDVVVKQEELENKDIERSIGQNSDSSYIPPTPEELRAVIWKLDLRIIPFLGLLYLCSFLDRVNIGNAKLAGITDDLQISASDYNVALSIFFIGYIIFEVPSNIILKKIGPSKWIPIVMISWGTVMAAMAACHNTAGLLASRFFLGITEAGLFPGVIFYLTLWYKRREQASRVAFFFSCSTLAGAFGGVLAYGIMQMDGIRGLHGWQWIFIIEAIPTLLLSIVSYFFLPDFPENSKFINEREREVVVHRLKEDAGPSTETHFSWTQLRAAFTDYRVYVHSLIYVCGSTPLYSLSLFLPSIIQGMGFNDLRAQAMSAPPYAIACFITILVAIHADKHGERGWHIAIPAAVGAIGYGLLYGLRHHGAVAMYIAACITVTGVFSHIPAMLSWFGNNIGGHTKRGVASAIIISLGNVGGAIGGQIYRIDDAPLYGRANLIAMGLMCCVVLFSLLFKWSLNRENKRRDELTEEEYNYEASKFEPCDRHPGFRYMS
ncbi:major facilitator superfamily domain-containing protein [Cokeromyces recurvatus]|uniref:major facilitator superfamily domain-containing protein n=1 Tax=Cokeromyces recurvatus TaxID=90255 RepID=UPI00221F6A27|nr:major facilitator superfamily domain-containing protein [Cokeromyces recurvatus]KAI7902835.1 major facilitator superfamily domain-containing protein [Cokeromyces recurvatus]